MHAATILAPVCALPLCCDLFTQTLEKPIKGLLTLGSLPKENVSLRVKATWGINGILFKKVFTVAFQAQLLPEIT